MESRGNYRVRPVSEIGSGTFGRVELIELYNSDDLFADTSPAKFSLLTMILLDPSSAQMIGEEGLNEK